VPQHGIEIQITLCSERPNRLTRSTPPLGMYDDGCVRQLAKHDCGITPQIGRVRQQDNLNFLPPFMQPPPGHESISSIIFPLPQKTTMRSAEA